MDEENCVGNEPSLVDTCDVCGDKATGEHYTAMTCNACRDFFERSIHNNVSYRCATKNCEISHHSSDKYCDYCYLYKCLEVGMTCGFVPRTWVRLMNRLTCEVPEQPFTATFTLMELGSVEAREMYPRGLFGTTYAAARTPEFIVTIPPSVHGNSDSSYYSSDSECEGTSRDLDGAGVSSGVEDGWTSRVTEGLGSSNSMQSPGRCRGNEGVGLSNDIDCTGKSRSIEGVEFSNGMEDAERSRGMKGLGFSNSSEGAGRSRGMEGLGSSSSMENTVASSGMNSTVTSSGVKPAAPARGAQDKAISRSMEGAGTSSGMGGADTSNGMRGVESSIGVKCATTSSMQDVEIARGMEGTGMFGGMEGAEMFGGMEGTVMFGGMEGTEMFGGIEGARIFGGPRGAGMFGGMEGAGMSDMACEGIFTLKLIRFPRDVQDGGTSRSSRSKLLRRWSHLQYVKKLFKNENFNSDCDVLTPNSLNLPLEVPACPHHHLSFHVVCESSSRIVFNLARWVFTLPHFVAMPDAIQVALYRETWPSLYVLELSRWAAPIGLHSFLPMVTVYLEEELRNQATWSTPSATPRPTTDDYPEKLRHLRQFIRTMEQMQVTDTEYAYMRALCLYGTDRVPSSLTHELEELQSKVVRSLLACNHDNEDRYFELLILLSTISRFTDDFLQDVFFVSLKGNVCIDDTAPYILMTERQLIEN